ncbi:hypothetical protein C0995_013756, partial [Termitomyces sp. Mi166
MRTAGTGQLLTLDFRNLSSSRNIGLTLELAKNPVYECFAMGQYFQVHNIDNATPVETSMWGKWDQNFWRNLHDSDFMRALWSIPEGQKHVVVKPYPSGQLAPNYKECARYLRCPKESDANLDGNGILKLPNEVIALIFPYLDEISYFAMSCQRFFGIASPFLEQDIQKVFVRSWAGDRLICLGDESDPQFPHDMLTERE